MAFYHYFSKDADKRAKFIFNFIAPVYGLADKVLKKNFEQAALNLKNTDDFSDKRIIDIGTGTGAWAAAMNSVLKPKEVSGTDFSANMIKQARKKHPEIDFFRGNGEDLSDIPDNAYDIASASLVLHGVKEDKRAKLLDEMERIAKEKLIFQDFVGKTPFFIRILEYLEKSDYKHFKENFCKELQSRYGECFSKQMRAGIGLYVAELNKEY
jgi:ubiquinone/menaquinone biosynthesis C-methylase UbiE